MHLLKFFKHKKYLTYFKFKNFKIPKADKSMSQFREKTVIPKIVIKKTLRL